MNHYIFILVGKSATGKDTIYERLLREPSLHLHRVVPYTTRPARSDEHEGEEYHFVSPEQFFAMRAAGKVIEYRCYHTCYGPWYYFTADDGQLCAGDSAQQTAALMIGTLESFHSIAAYFAADPATVVVPLYIEVEESVRRERAIAREKHQEHPRFDELERRFAADEEDFSEAKLTAAGIVTRFENRILDQCVQELSAYIQLQFR